MTPTQRSFHPPSPPSLHPPPHLPHPSRAITYMGDAIQKVASVMSGTSFTSLNTPSCHQNAVLFASEDVLMHEEHIQLIQILCKDICMVDTYSTLASKDDIYAGIVCSTLQE